VAEYNDYKQTNVTEAISKTLFLLIIKGYFENLLITKNSQYVMHYKYLFISSRLTSVRDEGIVDNKYMHAKTKTLNNKKKKTNKQTQNNSTV
jgi:hypothetical protein